jgi:protein O-mannosyl-transferase
VLVVVVVAIFAPTLWHGFVNWDDGQHVYANPVVTEPWSRPTWERLTTPSVGYPTPLPSFVHGLLWMIGQGAAWPFHACSLAVHLVIASLLLRTLHRRGVDAWLALGGTLVFAIHPIVVEPVAWVTGLKDLGVGLAVVALLVTSMPRTATEEGASRTTSDQADAPSRVVLARLRELGAWLIAITSKPSAGLLGLAFLVTPWNTRSTAPAPRSSPSWEVTSTSILAALTSIVGVFTLWFARVHQPDAIRTTLDTPWTVSRPLAALGVMVEHLLAPVGLSPVTPAASTTTTHVIVGALVAFALTAAWIHFVGRRDERAYWLTLALLAWLPVSNVVPLVRFTADSYVYVPWLLLCATLTVSVHEFTSSEMGRASSPSVARLARVGAIAWLAVSSVGSALQVRVWRDDVSLWTAAVDAHPDEGALVVRLGDALGRSGDVRVELALYFAHEHALEAHGVVPPALLAFLGARGDEEALARWFSIGLRAQTGQIQQAETFYGYYVAFVVRSGREPADVDGLAFARGLPLVSADPADYGITTAEHEAALEGWRRRISTAGAPP